MEGQCQLKQHFSHIYIQSSLSSEGLVPTRTNSTKQLAEMETLQAKKLK